MNEVKYAIQLCEAEGVHLSREDLEEKLSDLADALRQYGPDVVKGWGISGEQIDSLSKVPPKGVKS